MAVDWVGHAGVFLEQRVRSVLRCAGQRSEEADGEALAGAGRRQDAQHGPGVRQEGAVQEEASQRPWEIHRHGA